MNHRFVVDGIAEGEIDFGGTFANDFVVVVEDANGVDTGEDMPHLVNRPIVTGNLVANAGAGKGAGGNGFPGERW